MLPELPFGVWSHPNREQKIGEIPYVAMFITKVPSSYGTCRITNPLPALVVPVGLELSFCGPSCWGMELVAGGEADNLAEVWRGQVSCLLFLSS